MLIINDIEGNYLPIMGVSISELFYDMEIKQNYKIGNTCFGLSMSFFNAIACAWEPAIEQFSLKVKQEEADGSKAISLDIADTLSINLTE